MLFFLMFIVIPVFSPEIAALSQQVQQVQRDQKEQLSSAIVPQRPQSDRTSDAIVVFPTSTGECTLKSGGSGQSIFDIIEIIDSNGKSEG